jgi:hypothetical protein
MLTTSVSRDDMVQGKLPGFFATVLTDIAVAIENLNAG